MPKSGIPIFVVGFPRSGTTLLQSLICTHDIVSFPETHFFSTVTHRLCRDSWFDVSPQQLGQLLGNVHRLMCFRLPASDEQRLTRLAETGQLDLRVLFEAVIDAYCETQGLGNLVSSGRRWLEKTPDHVRNMDKIRLFYPNAVFVAIVRDPLSALYSYHRNLVAYRRPYPKLARQWGDSVAAIERLKGQAPGNIVCLRYEDLVEDPDTEMARVFRFLGLPFDGNRLSEQAHVVEKFILPHETWKDKNRRCLFGNVSDADLNGMGRKDILYVQHLLKSDMQQYGYRIRYPYSQYVFSMQHRIRSKITRLARRWGWRRS